MGTAVRRIIDREYRDRAAIVAGVGGTGDMNDLAKADAVIDFSLPAGTRALVDWLDARPDALPAVVCGTTGLDAGLRGRLDALGERTAVLYASNFSPGAAALEAVLDFAAPMLGALGYTPVMTEVHHRHKRDAPSGTAKTLAAAIDPANPASVEIHSVRAGEIIGLHEVTFYGTSDRIALAHEALDRGLFARGAVEAALWLAAPADRRGAYSMASYFRERYVERH